MHETAAPGAGDARGRMGATDCERLRAGPVAQPVNTLTSLGYVAGAGMVLCRVGRGNPDGRRPVVVYSALLALVGAGSVAFHGPQPAGAKLMHDLPIPVLLGVALGTPLARRLRGAEPAPGWTKGRAAALAGITVAAAACYAAGRTGAPTCDPDSPVQFHGAWHLVSAAAFVVGADILHGGS